MATPLRLRECLPSVWERLRLSHLRVFFGVCYPSFDEYPLHQSEMYCSAALSCGIARWSVPIPIPSGCALVCPTQGRLSVRLQRLLHDLHEVSCMQTASFLAVLYARNTYQAILTCVSCVVSTVPVVDPPGNRRFLSWVSFPAII